MGGRAATGADMRPEPLEDPPLIDPAGHAVRSWLWGDTARLYLVRWQGRHLVWLARPADDYTEVCELAGEGAAREYFARERARLLLFDYHEPVAQLTIPGQHEGESHGGIIWDAVVADGGPAGIWYACMDATGAAESLAAERFGDQGSAVAEFARAVEEAADRVEVSDLTERPEIAAARMREAAARARAEAARARLGDAIRQDLALRSPGDSLLMFDEDCRAVHRAAGTDYEMLREVLAGAAWAWPARGSGVPPTAGEVAAAEAAEVEAAEMAGVEMAGAAEAEAEVEAEGVDAAEANGATGSVG
jgi:hypothetical protein